MRSSVSSIITAGLCLLSQLASSSTVDFKQEWQLQDAFQEHSAVRDKICLNGRWQIQLLTADELKAALTVPSATGVQPEKALSVKQQMLRNMQKINEKTTDAAPSYPAKLIAPKNDPVLYLYVPGLFYDPDGRQTGLQGAGLTNAQRAGWGATRQLTWNGRNIAEYPGAIYQREITVSNPVENYFVQLENVRDQAVIYVNGQFAGVAEGVEAAQIPISKFLRNGTNTLQLVMKAESKGRICGLLGDVWLLRRPAEQFIRHAFLETADFAKKQVKLMVNLDGNPQGQFEVTFQDRQGRQTTVPAGSLTPVNIPTGRNDHYYVAKFEFPGAEPWTTQHPNLYKCTVTWKNDGTIIDETIPVNFGFRELKIDGRSYMLNGSKLHFRNAILPGYLCHLEFDNIKRYFTECKQAGINSICMWIHGIAIPDNILSLADEQGMMLTVVLYGVEANYKNWNDSSVRAKVRKQLTDYLKTVQNHPSVLNYSLDPSIMAYPQDISPYGIAHDTLVPEEDYDNNKAQSGPTAEFAGWVKAFDPHKAVWQYAGGAYGGDIYSTMIYLNFVQLQDKKSWLDGWSKTGTKPFFAIEMGMPWDSSYYHDHISGTVEPRSSEPMLAEYCAIDAGDIAYPLDNKEWYRKTFACEVKPHAQNGNDLYVNSSLLFYAYFRAGRPRHLLQQERLLFTETIRAWRYRGASMTPWSYADMIADNDGRLEEAVPVNYKNYKTPGLKPFYKLNSMFKRYNDNYKALTESMAERLVFIADQDGFRADHSYYAGEPVMKRVILINDSDRTIDATFNVRAVRQSDNETVFSGDLNLNCPPGEVAEGPFSFKCASVPQREQYKIIANGMIEGKAYHDEFMIEVFPSEQKIASPQHQFYLYNPDNGAALPEQLNALGLKYQAYTPGMVLHPATDELIIARNALPKLKASFNRIIDFVKNGGSVLVMEQQAEILNELFQLKTLHLNSRTMFKSFDSENRLGNLADADLKNWRGDSDFLPLDNTWEKSGYPRHIWKISQQGIVSSLLIQRPHTGAYRSWINGGFDLDYSGLLELGIGQGRLFFCQLDISSRCAKNPDSMTALRGIINLIDTLPAPAGRYPVFYAGNDQQAQQLIKTLGIKCGGNASTPDTRQTMLVGANASEQELALAKQHLKNGGTALFLARKNPASLPAEFMPPSAVKFDDYSLNKLPELPLLSGLTLADFYWKDYYRYPLFKSGDSVTPVIAVKALNGTAVYCQIDPYAFGIDPDIQRQMRAQQKQLRVIASLLNRLGVDFPFDTSVASRFDGIVLEDKWGFRTDPRNDGEKAGFQNGFMPQHQLDPTRTWQAQGITEKNPNVHPEHPKDYNGIAWYRHDVIIPPSAKGTKIYFRAQIDDYDVTWFNGVKIGETDEKTKNAFREYRKYLIPENLIKYGEINHIVTKVNDVGFDGGFWSDRRMNMWIGIFPDRVNAGPYHDAGYDYDPYLFRRW